MASTNAPRADVRDVIRSLRFQLYQAQRRVDRFIRLHHRAKEEAVQSRWFKLAEQNDQLAADVATKLREVLASRS